MQNLKKTKIQILSGEIAMKKKYGVVAIAVALAFASGTASAASSASASIGPISVTLYESTSLY